MTIINDSQNKSVLVAMSGGVDSSVSTMLLSEQGFSAQGITMQLVREKESADSSNTAKGVSQDVKDAAQICNKLGIKHHVLDCMDTFEEQVVCKFCNGYSAGETPNPCIDCNKAIKFGLLQQHREKLGFDYLATGHYVRCKLNEKTGRYEILRAKDPSKDQSYVLYHLNQDVLAHSIFPLGSLTKKEVRKIAADRGFKVAQKGESQDICFIPDGDYIGFIQRNSDKSSKKAFEHGNIVDKSGKVLGEHLGLIRYTIGQRKGIGVAHSEPLYVFSKNVEKNELVVGTDKESLCNGIDVVDANFIAREKLEQPEKLFVKTHYRSALIGATVEQLSDSELRITFDEPRRACAPGQAAVAYDGEAVVCGGTILRSW